MTPIKPKYNYDIEMIKKRQNEALAQGKRKSIRAIARECKWPEDSTQQWIRRNFTESVDYTPKGEH